MSDDVGDRGDIDKSTASNIAELSDSALDRGAPKPMGVKVEKTALLVLGMHRSGTSATTRVLNLLGADLPSNLMLPKAENNEAGFWESLDTYLLNDKILQSAGSRWDDWRRFNPDWIRSATSQAFRSRALEILEREFSRSPFFVLKDPRICRLLPFWLDVFREFGSEIKCVLPLRNPLEIAASLEKRDGISPAKSHMLWLRHVLEVEKATRKLPRWLMSQPKRRALFGVPGLQSNKLTCGGARHGGNRETSVAKPFTSRWVRIFSITSGSSMHAMIRTAPPQARQVSM